MVWPLVLGNSMWSHMRVLKPLCVGALKQRNNEIKKERNKQTNSVKIKRPCFALAKLLIITSLSLIHQLKEFLIGRGGTVKANCLRHNACIPESSSLWLLMYALYFLFCTALVQNGSSDVECWRQHSIFVFFMIFCKFSMNSQPSWLRS